MKQQSKGVRRGIKFLGGKKMKKIIVGLLMMTVIAGVSYGAVDYNVTYSSQYIWRGFDNLGMAGYANAAAIQPGITVSDGSGWSAGIWGNYALASPRGFFELDALIGYSGTWKKGLDYSVGYTYYTFPIPNAAAATTSGELYTGLSWTEALFAPSLTVYYDHTTAGGNGTYVNLSGGRDFTLGNLGISSSLAIGYNAGQWGATSGISDIVVGLSSPFAMGELTVTPSINYASIPSTTGINTQASEFWFALDLAGSI